MKKSPTAPRAEYETKEVTPLMTEYAAWLTKQTGYAVDPRSVFLSSALRTAFQAERRATHTLTAADNIDADPTLDDPKPVVAKQPGKPRTRRAAAPSTDSTAPEAEVPA